MASKDQTLQTFYVGSYWKNTSSLGFVLALLIACTQCDYLSECQAQCNSSLNFTLPDSSDSCDSAEKVLSCFQGCKFWNITYRQDCSEPCKSTYDKACQRDSCDIGCGYAVNTGKRALLDKFNSPVPPIASVIGSHNISLRWKSANSSWVKYIVQWKYTVLQEDWRYTEIVTNHFYTVKDLKPYTLYHFRVVWIIFSQLQLYSPPSRTYRTKSFGVPLTAPVIVNVESPSPFSVEVSWNPPLFPSGPLVGYNLKLINEDHLIHQAASGSASQISIYPTNPDTNYRLSVAAVNRYGAGTAADVNITTLPLITSSGEQWLFLSRYESLRKVIITDATTGEAECLQAKIKHNITAITVHFYRKKVYFSEGNQIWIKGAANMSDLSDLQLLYNGSGIISAISVDWLYQKLYFVMNGKIFCCDLDSCLMARNIMSGHFTAPVRIVADPYNGYIYLLREDRIYRMQLPDSKNRSSDDVISLTKKSGFLKDFAIHFESKRLFFYNDTNQSISSTFIDGSSLYPVRHSLFFQKVRSLAYAKNYFTLTDGNQVQKEIQAEGMYFYNYVTVECDSSVSQTGFNNLQYYSASDQPYPIPTHPRYLESLFNSDVAVLKWKKPEPTVKMSPTAWQEWTYEVRMEAQNSSDELVFRNIRETIFTVENLHSSTVYRLAARAVSPGGASPWTPAFTGSTLQEVEEEPFILAARKDGIWKQRLDSFGPGILLFPDLKYARGMDWYNGTLYWANSSGHVHKVSLFNNSSSYQGHTYIPQIETTGTIAYDWIGQNLYWNDKFTNMIYRKPVSSAAEEIVILAGRQLQDLTVDSINAFIYWTTAQTIESARLNGENHFVHQELPAFSDRWVFGCTVDLDHGFLYWVVQDRMCLHLYKSTLRQNWHENNTALLIEAWSMESISQHAFGHYSNRFHWINRNGYLTVQEENQKNSVFLSRTKSFTFTLVQESLKPLPEGFSSPPNVIPECVSESSITIKGNYSVFRVVWNGSENVDYGTVYYCVQFSALQLHEDYCLAKNSLTLPELEVLDLEPFTEFNFSITPYTYWGKGTTTQKNLHSPESVPSPPENLRIFVSNSDTLRFTNQSDVEFRWNIPRRKNGIITKYRVQYTLLNNMNKSFKVWNQVDVKPTMASYKFKLTTHLIYAFRVQAFTSVGPGSFSEIVEANTSVLKSVPRILIACSDKIKLIDVDNNVTEEVIISGGHVTALSFHTLDEMIYYIRNDTLLSMKTEDGSKIELLKDERLYDPADITMDWIGRRLYIASSNARNVSQVFIVDLDAKIKFLEVVNLTAASHHTLISSLAAYPLLSRLYWIQNSSAGTRMLCHNLVNGTSFSVFGDQEDQPQGSIENNRCNCSAIRNHLSGKMAIDSSSIQLMKIYFTTKSNEIWLSDLDGCQCNRVIRVPVWSDIFLENLTIDQLFIYWSISTGDKTTVYQADKGSGSILWSVSEMDPVRLQVSSFGFQPFPDIACLVPSPYTELPSIVSVSNTSVTINLPPSHTEMLCPGISIPRSTFLVYYRKMQGSNDTFNCSSVLNCIAYEVQDTLIHLKGLQPYSAYLIQAAATNYYGGFPHKLGDAVIAMTDYGVPEAVSNVTVNVISNKVFDVLWTEPSQPNGPIERVRYQIKGPFHKLYPSTPLTKSELAEGKLALSLTNAKGGTLYSVMVLAFHPDYDWFSVSEPVYIKTFECPSAPFHISLENTTVQVKWEAPSDNSTRRFEFELREFVPRTIWKTPNVSCSEGPDFVCCLSGLQPARVYQVRVMVIYHTGAESVSKQDTFKTLAGVPGKPGTPQQFEENGKSVSWEKGDDNGSNITYYILEVRKSDINKVSGGNMSASEPWEVVWNSSCNTRLCTWKAEDLKGAFLFRVAASNAIGIGEYSDVSKEITLKDGGNALLSEAGIAVTVVSCVFLVAVVGFSCGWYRKHQNKIPQANEVTTVFKPDAELARIRGMTLVGLSNGCYAISTLPSQSEIGNLPEFPRAKLSLSRFLGSGAFGEVYEGNAVDILGEGSGESKVAVKTLKKGATDHEKSEFLKEAHLMRQFDHPHILRLLGVCLLNEPQYIILELMEGGDLLTYLRESRTVPLRRSLLDVTDLLDISLDVSKGCTYLEKMHFVHRDLAARNCLVSTKKYDNPNRTVKIGDFGLARDVYKNDYYRKRGEGLLPVRWMAPESLIDGVFTNYSDVWSFGVLLWEIATLGQQPYQTYSNLEVLHFVRSGGRLETPSNCPDDVYSLMLKCWHREPKKRPSFRYIQDKLEQLRKSPLVCSHIVSDEDSRPQGIINLAFENAEEDHGDHPDCASLSILTTVTNKDGLHYMMLPSANTSDDLEYQDLANHLRLTSEDSEAKIYKEVQDDTPMYSTCDHKMPADVMSPGSANYAIITVFNGDCTSLIGDTRRRSTESISSRT